MNVPTNRGAEAIDRLPVTFIVLLFMVNVPPLTTTFVGESTLPALLVHVPPVFTSISPPIVVLVPSTVTIAVVDILLPPLGAVFPENVIAGRAAPFNNKLAPPTYMPPPRLLAELVLKLVELLMVVGRDSTMIPPPFAAELFEKVEVPIDAEPEPIPPGAAKAKIKRSAPPPPIPADVLRLKVDPVTVKVPVPPVCCGDDGV